MNGLTARWPHLSGTGRAGAFATVTFAVTGAADVLLTAGMRQAWAAPLASVLILVPGLYLAWKAVPASSWHGSPRRAGAWDPAVLGVHDVTGGGPLPPYVRRPHDDLLDALLDPAVTASRLVVLRGGSSTGKTRAAFEASARGRLARWRLEYPRGEADLAGLLDAGVPARTIVWLGELRDYTAGPDGGAGVLGRLARLLETRDQVIAVTTLWPGHWDSYLAAARTRDRLDQDPAGTAGRLLARLPDLTGHTSAEASPARGGVLDVPAMFTPAEVIAAARADPRLAAAVAAAAGAGQDGQVAQYLAGVPDLLARLDGPGDPYGQAIIKAAMDAARLGCQAPLPRAFLIQAAAGYLTPAERTLDADAWAGPALTWATEKLNGAVQAVQPVPRPYGTGTAGYRPADYLDQHGRGTRRHETGTAELWDALTAHVTATADLARLAGTAENYGLYRPAFQLYTAAAEAGDTTALKRVAWMLEKAGRAEEAIAFYQRAAEAYQQGAEAGDTSARLYAAEMLQKAGRTEEAITSYQQAAEVGITGHLGPMMAAGAMAVAARLLQETGRTEEAITWLQSRAEAGNNVARWDAAEVLQRAGRTAEAIISYQQAAEAYQQAAEAGDTYARLQAAEMLQKAGRTAEAITSYQQAAKAGHTTAMEKVAELLQRAGRTEEAISFYEQAAEVYQRIAEAGGISELGKAAEMLAKAGRTEESRIFSQRAAEAKEPTRGEKAAEMLAKAGRTEESARLRRYGMEPGGRIADPWEASTDGH